MITGTASSASAFRWRSAAAFGQKRSSGASPAANFRGLAKSSKQKIARPCEPLQTRSNEASKLAGGESSHLPREAPVRGLPAKNQFWTPTSVGGRNGTPASLPQPHRAYARGERGSAPLQSDLEPSRRDGDERNPRQVRRRGARLRRGGLEDRTSVKPGN